MCVGPYGGPKGGAVSYERGTPVPHVGLQMDFVNNPDPINL